MFPSFPQNRLAHLFALFVITLIFFSPPRLICNTCVSSTCLKKKPKKTLLSSSE